MSRYTNQLLSYINDNPNKNLTLVVNTNLGVTPAKLNSFIRKLKLIQHKVKRIDIATSGESYGSCAEYVRDGLDYNRWYNNCVTVLTEIPKVRLHIMCAYNLFAITSFTQFLTDVKKLKDSYKNVLVSVTYVRDPAFMSIALAPKDWLHYLEESKLYLKTNFSRESVKRFDHAVAFFNTSFADDKDLTHLKNFILEYDKRRNKNFLNVFPEYKFIFA
jgi:hypothetical protein